MALSNPVVQYTYVLRILLFAVLVSPQDIELSFSVVSLKHRGIEPHNILLYPMYVALAGT